MKAVSGLISRMRWRKGAKSGLASGIRIASRDLPALLRETHPESGLRLNARRPIID